ncbi:hypothetical protein ACFY41_24615 [Streptomyces syringium]
MTGDMKGGDGIYHNYEGHRLGLGQSVTLAGFYKANGVKNIRIAID